MLGVVRLRLLGRHHFELHLLNGEPRALEAVHDFADVAIAHTVGLDHRVSLLNCHASFLSRGIIAKRMRHLAQNPLVLTREVQIDVRHLPADHIAHQ